jgi:hypothetical protein
VGSAVRRFPCAPAQAGARAGRRPEAPRPPLGGSRRHLHPPQERERDDRGAGRLFPDARAGVARRKKRVRAETRRRGEENRIVAPLVIPAQLRGRPTAAPQPAPASGSPPDCRAPTLPRTGLKTSGGCLHLSMESPFFSALPSSLRSLLLCVSASLRAKKRPPRRTALSKSMLRKTAQAASNSSSAITGPLSCPLAAGSRSTSSMIPIGAASEARMPALSTRV